MPNGDTHMNFRKVEVADTVPHSRCNFRCYMTVMTVSTMRNFMVARHVNALRS